MNILKGFKSRKSLFEKLIKHRLNELYSQAYRLLGNRTQAEDLVQDFVLRLYKNNIDLSKYDNLRAWLYKGLYRQFLNHLRTNNRTPFGYLDDEQSNAIDNTCLHHDSPEYIAELHSEVNQIQIALQKLNTDHRDLIIMHDIEGFTLPELVEIVAVPLGTLKSRLHRARNTLKNELNMEPYQQQRCVKN